jgi:hypothetical protein
MKIFTKPSLSAGKPTTVTCAEIDGQIYCVSGGVAGRLVRIARLEDDWHADVEKPEDVIRALEHCPKRPDIFTFWQRPPDTEPRYPYYRESDVVALLPIATFDDWWNKQIKPATRNLIRKAERKGVEVREAAFDDHFVRGMVDIFNETPVRQGRRFWHYGKDFATVKEQFSTYLFRETLIGAYHEGRLIGFIMLSDAGKYGEIGQIISMIAHRDKSPNNALLAEAVRVCARRGLPHLVYAYWADSSLTDFKRHNGFQASEQPRYYVPLTVKGRYALNAGVHHGWKQLLPAGARDRLKRLRARLLTYTTPRTSQACQA